MDAAKRADFFQRLEAKIREGDVETNLVPPEDDMSETLRAMLPVTDEGDASLLEIMAAPYVDDANLLIFYTTMVAKIGTGYEDLLRAIPQWNLECPLGGYGIFEGDGRKQLFHKYTMLYNPEFDPEDLAEIAMFHVTMLYEIISLKYKEARRTAKGEGAE